MVSWEITANHPEHLNDDAGNIVSYREGYSHATFVASLLSLLPAGRQSLRKAIPCVIVEQRLNSTPGWPNGIRDQNYSHYDSTHPLPCHHRHLRGTCYSQFTIAV